MGCPFVPAHSSRKPGAFSTLPIRAVPDVYLALCVWTGQGRREREDFLNLLETEPIYEDPSLLREKKTWLEDFSSCSKLLKNDHTAVCLHIFLRGAARPQASLMSEFSLAEKMK